MSPAFAERPVQRPDQGLVARLEHFRDEFKPFLEHLKFAVLIPLSWTLTLWRFVLIIIWRIWVSASSSTSERAVDQRSLQQTLPLRLCLTFYERQVRRAFPWLPSIYGTLNSLFPGGIKLPSLTSLTAGPYKGEGPTGPELPTLDMSGDIDDIINGTGNGDASSQQLEATSRKSAQAETEKALESLGVSS
ncbi:hypothetical protein BC826DRAFT_990199 [Russula brevipes]|nr:hypothetical protein BC826DRAFT_990199 [Russula brevipes]